MRQTSTPYSRRGVMTYLVGDQPTLRTGQRHRHVDQTSDCRWKGGYPFRQPRIEMAVVEHDKDRSRHEATGRSGGIMSRAKFRGPGSDP